MWPFSTPRQDFVNTIPTPTNPDTLPLSAKELESLRTAQAILTDSPLAGVQLLTDEDYAKLTGYSVWRKA